MVYLMAQRNVRNIYVRLGRKFFQRFFNEERFRPMEPFLKVARRKRVKETRTRRSIPVYIQRDEEDNGKGDGESRRGGVSVCKVHREKTSGVG